MDTDQGAQSPIAEPEPARPDALSGDIEKVRADEGFTKPARRLLERDREIIDRLGR